jgi:hypothetical protein
LRCIQRKRLGSLTNSVIPAELAETEFGVKPISAVVVMTEIPLQRQPHVRTRQLENSIVSAANDWVELEVAADSNRIEETGHGTPIRKVIVGRGVSRHAATYFR